MTELNKYRSVDETELRQDLSQRWIIERGLIAAAEIIFDVTDHILAAHYSVYSETYEDSLEKLNENKVISDSLYNQLRGLGGFRNILVHRYLGIDIANVAQNFQKGLKTFPQFAQEILVWLDSQRTV
ncbi:MAG: DUF86 domain-containing protein [Anaerolineae bacterium]|nr:DUF86 domain-containing protein [Anaerolineae bacterium]